MAILIKYQLKYLTELVNSIYHIEMEAIMKDKRTRILEACAECVNVSGFKKTSIQDICNKAGVAKGLAYYYFEDKNELMYQTYLYYVTKMKLYFSRDASNIDDTFDMVSYSVRSKATFCKDFPSAWKFMALSKDCNNRKIKEYNDTTSEDLLSKMWSQIDTSRVKDEVDLNSILKMLGLIAESLLTKIHSETDIDSLMKEYDSYLETFKKITYKEEQ